MLNGDDLPPDDDDPFLDRAFHATRLAAAVHNVKVTWAKRQRREAKLAQLAASEADPPSVHTSDARPEDVQSVVQLPSAPPPVQPTIWLPGKNSPPDLPGVADLPPACYGDRHPPAQTSIGPLLPEYRIEQPNTTPDESLPLVNPWFVEHLDKAVEVKDSMQSAFRLSSVRFNSARSGAVKISGGRVAAEEGFEFESMYYATKEVALDTGRGLLWRAIKGGLVTAGVVSLIVNSLKFGTNPAEGATFWDRTVKNREFWVSTAVDTVISFAVGLVAAALVAGAIAGAVALGIAAAATVPLWVTVGVTAIVSIFIGNWVDKKGVPELLKNIINGLF